MENEKYVMHTDEHGFDIYVGPMKYLEIELTDDQAEAELWSQMDVKSQIKIDYMRALTGLNFQWKKITENAF